MASKTQTEGDRTMTQTEQDQLNAGDRVKGYGPDVPACTYPANMGTVAETDRSNALVEWDTGETRWHWQTELKRI